MLNFAAAACAIYVAVVITFFFAVVGYDLLRDRRRRRRARRGVSFGRRHIGATVFDYGAHRDRVDYGEPMRARR